MSKSFVGKVELDAGLVNHIEAIMYPVPDDEKVQLVGVSAGSLIQYLAEALFLALNAVASRELNISQDDISDVLSYLIQARAAQCAGLRVDEHPSQIHVPALMNPLLMSIGNYESTEANISLRPIPALRDRNGNAPYTDDGIANPKFCVTRPDKYREVLLTLRIFGVPTTVGLPRDRDVEDDAFFRYGLVDEVLKGPYKAPRPSPALAYTRALVEMAYCANIYGDLQTSYLAVSRLKTGIDAMVFSQVRGPGRHLAP